jgi:hypothetical protein
MYDGPFPSQSHGDLPLMAGVVFTVCAEMFFVFKHPVRTIQLSFSGIIKRVFDDNLNICTYLLFETFWKFSGYVV